MNKYHERESSSSISTDWQISAFLPDVIPITRWKEKKEEKKKRKEKKRGKNTFRLKKRKKEKRKNTLNSLSVSNFGQRENAVLLTKECERGPRKDSRLDEASRGLKVA